MTDLLKDMMNERADALGAPDLDVRAMVRDGDRRANRRLRTAIAGAAVAAAVAAAVVVPSIATRDTASDELVTGSLGGPLAYAANSTIHTEQGSVDVGRRILAFVHTPTGFVVADVTGAVRSVVGSEIIKVGQMDPEEGMRFASDGDVVAWVEGDPEGEQYAVLDHAAGTEVVRGRAGTRPVLDRYCDQVCPMRIIAVDGRTLYFDDARGVLARNPLDSEPAELIPAVGGERPVVLDVAGGLIARLAAGETRVGPDLDGGQQIDGSDLSPDGQYLLSESPSTWDRGIQPKVFDAATGDAVPVDIAGAYWEAHAYRWLDGDTFAVLARDQDDDLERFVTCDVGGECSVEFSVPVDVPVLLPAR
ncbi:hypothetical protein [Nocardioides sp.]|uniref:hypothetical protein n=1 Tax=Nocardioides sp. TaxID=35761 RepID=UPI002B564530|nr:hypothetical protein [Nocardioides sp.]HXH80834.1 hypothetical protein [Nocardioides sp.]